MAESDIALCNNALTLIGEPPISAFTDDRKAARVALREYIPQRNALLRKYIWNFAIARVSLGPEAEGPAFGFTNRFVLPPDNLKFLGLFDPSELQTNYSATKIPHKVEGPYLLMDDAEAKVFYISGDLADNTLLFDPLFDKALGLELAIVFAYDINRGLERIEQMEKQFKQAIKDAKFADAIVGTAEFIEASEWLDSRMDRFGPPRIGPIL